MERAPDRGRAWRERLLPLVAELGHVAFNPNVEEERVVPREERERFAEWKAAGDPRFVERMRRVIEHDLAALERADYVVCYWDEHARGSGGTPSEVTLAHRLGKPVYLVLGVPRSEISSWVLGCATRAFESFDDLGRFLRQEYAAP